MTVQEDVTAVLVRYATGIDSRDWDLFRTVFTPDCRLDYGGIGQWDSCEAVTRFMQKAHSGPSMHRLSNFAIEVAGDRATSRTYVDAVVLGPGGRGGAHNIGYYDDELVNTADGWRIARRHYTAVWMRLLGLGIVPSRLAIKLSNAGARRIAAAAARS